MPVKHTDFLKNHGKFGRYQDFVLAAVLFTFAVGTVALGIFLYGKYTKGKSVAAANSRNPASCVLPKDWLLKYFGTDDVNNPKVGGPEGDMDGDFLTNCQEYAFGTNPMNPDTDKDGGLDGIEVAFGQNPNGAGELPMTQGALDYAKQVIFGDQNFQNFSEEKVTQKVNDTFQPDREVVLDMPADTDIILSTDNSKEAIEKYYNDSMALSASDGSESQDVQARLFNGMSQTEIDYYLKKMQTAEQLLREMPVPSELASAHKYKIAGMRAGIRIFELVRDNFNNGSPGQNFWADVFYQTTAAHTAALSMLSEWTAVAVKLKDMGGI
ncbi:hypothetical protein D4R52_01160 [bacterium]|nr:MAG: hypothetical protein D4R52_01160 [bacterium]